MNTPPITTATPRPAVGETWHHRQDPDHHVTITDVRDDHASTVVDFTWGTDGRGSTCRLNVFLQHYTAQAPAPAPSRWHARPRNWAITAAVCAVMVGGAIWPMPVVGAGGALVAAVALVHGIRAFRTEQQPGPAAVVEPALEQPPVRCCVCGAPKVVYENCNGQWFCWTCADCPCGQTPCVRTGINDPAVSAEAATRARKVRVGDAIREYLKAHSVPVLVDPLGRPLPTGLGPSEYDVAAVAIDALAPELAEPCPTPETHNWGCPCDRAQRANAYRDAADRLWKLGEASSARHLGEWAQHLEQQDETERSAR